MNLSTELIARLGHACGLPWARCRGEWDHRRLRDRAECVKHRGHGGDCLDRYGNRDRPVVHQLPSTLAEWAAEWEREHPGEPGPVAFWTDGTVGWSVTPPTPNTVPRVITVRIVIGDIVATLMDVVGGVPQWHVRSGFGTKDDILLLGRLMEAAEHPIGTPGVSPEPLPWRRSRLVSSGVVARETHHDPTLEDQENQEQEETRRT